MKGARIVVPPVVVAETHRGSRVSARIDYLLARAVVPDTDLDLARSAGRLLAETGGVNAADALVVAEAIREAPCVLLTGDPDDIRLLAAGLAGIGVIDINAL